MGSSSPTTDSCFCQHVVRRAKGSGRGCRPPREACCQHPPRGEPGGPRSRMRPRTRSPSPAGSGFAAWSAPGSAQRDGVLVGTSSVFCFCGCDVRELVCSAGAAPSAGGGGAVPGPRPPATLSPGPRAGWRGAGPDRIHTGQSPGCPSPSPTRVPGKPQGRLCPFFPLATRLVFPCVAPGPCLLWPGICEGKLLPQVVISVSVCRPPLLKTNPRPI